MSVEDFRINAFVRQVLSRFWVDPQAVRYGAAGRIVYLQGRFERLRAPSGDGDELLHRRRPEWIAENLALLDTVEREIRREALVQDVVFRLENFHKTEGKWVSTGA